MSSDIASPAPRCGQCNSTGTGPNLLRCSRCKVIHYCSIEHQQAHFPIHKGACKIVFRTRSSMETEEQRLRNFPGDVMTAADPFTTGVGHFWGIHETRDYMRDRFAFVEALQRMRSHDSVVAQLDHLKDMLRLSNSDNMGVRDLIPALYLRLDRDQECYDFIKWWETSTDYEWNDEKPGPLDVHNADVFEDAAFICNKYLHLAFGASMTLLKIKLLLDVQNLDKSLEKNGEKVPNEVFDGIQQHVVRSPIFLTPRNKIILEQKDHTDLILKLKRQIKQLYGTVNNVNRFYWTALLQPGRCLNSRPQMYSPGTKDEMVLKLQYTYDAWIETKGSLEVIRLLKQGKFE
ncbi:hypothetical protein BT63DRAFT_225724 [Microthyrium microscopicum]|uniref:MYND-type domain-containing protein n=1 Tax=Microthyrium microscopicum TaxID=703497 RepID=A0A6A6UCD3_9PEZI|nr:hypothetical protein BT63DRAFT_225724 [Microthyrium microscopicum]